MEWSFLDARQGREPACQKKRKGKGEKKRKEKRKEKKRKKKQEGKKSGFTQCWTVAASKQRRDAPGEVNPADQIRDKRSKGACIKKETREVERKKRKLKTRGSQDVT